jgi:hypothetical protein
MKFPTWASNIPRISRHGVQNLLIQIHWFNVLKLIIQKAASDLKGIIKVLLSPLSPLQPSL